MTLFRRLPAVKYGPERGYSEVLPAWKGGTVVCMATGPSLTDAQIETVRLARERGDVSGVVVLNDNYRRVPWADLLYFADQKWWHWHKDKPELAAFGGETCTIDTGPKSAGWDSTHILRNLGGEGLSVEPGGLRTGINTGHQILNIATLAGADRVLLLGYDARHADDKRVHWFGDHPDRTGPPFSEMLRHMRTTLPVLQSLGVKVINCTPGSAIDCFERGTIESLVADSQGAALPARCL